MEVKDLKAKLTLLGEFVDKDLEKEFCRAELKKSLNYIKSMALLLGIMFFLFIIPDYFLIKNTRIFIIILLNRIITVLLVAVFYFILDSIKEYSNLIFWITIYEMIFSCSFLFTYYLYPSANFIIQDLGLITTILVIYMVTNKLINMILVSITISFVFFFISFYTIRDLILSEFYAVIVYTLIITLVSTISKYRSNYFERMEYVSSCQLLVSSTTDSLTGIYNRLKLDLEIDKWINYSKINKTNLSLVILDFDDFKKVNDTYGHQAGDKILVDYTNIIKGMIRNLDIMARWGGDEFSILLPGASLEDTERLVVRIMEKISNTSCEAGKITCSFGMVSLKEDEDKMSFIKRADLKLYEAKALGKNCMKS